MDDHGELIGVWGASADITAEKRAEAESAADLERLNNIKKFEAMGRFAGVIVHDLNNILQGIMGYTDLALEQVPEGQTLRADLEEIQKIAGRAGQLTGRLQTFAHCHPVAQKIFLLNTALENMLGILHRLMGDQIQLVWKPGGLAGAVRMDPAQLEQIMTNLCSNARDAIKKFGRVTIATERVDIQPSVSGPHGEIAPGQYVLLSVQDNGAGMTPEVCDRVFEPFFNTKSHGLCAGLGMATVYGIVAQNDGHISIESVPGTGTLCKIYLPRYAPEQPQLKSRSSNLHRRQYRIAAY